MPNLSINLISLISNFSDILQSERAYLDPGSGSILIQLLVATLVGAIYIIRQYWSRIVRFFRRNHPESGGDDEMEDDE
jgi:hypothetical protein